MSMHNKLTFDAEEMSTREMYKILIGSIVPRPIAWVSTISKAGVLNVAPFSFFTLASRQPATLSVTITPEKKGEEVVVKDTLSNIRETEEFVVNIVPESLANEMYETSKDYPSDSNEFEEAKLTAEESQVVISPSIKESPIAFECRLYKIIEIGTDSLVLGSIHKIHIDQEVYLGDYKINSAVLKPLARIGKGYTTLSKIFNLPR